jgi:hypothetical protein
MHVKLELKSIEPVQSGQELAITYLASSQELGELELKILTSLQPDLNAAEQDARKMIAAFADGLRASTENTPLQRQKYLKHPA